jgi:hypothetical protein
MSLFGLTLIGSLVISLTTRSTLQNCCVPVASQVVGAVDGRTCADRQLEEKEMARIRKSLGEGWTRLGHQSGGPWAFQEILDVPNYLAELHKRNRLMVLDILLQIIRERGSDEALGATAYAVALEENPALAVLYAEAALASLDIDRITSGGAVRSKLINMVLNMKKDAEK